jgi:hypothetical protein
MTIDIHHASGLYYAYGRLDAQPPAWATAHTADLANEFATVYAAMRNGKGGSPSVQDAWTNFVRVKAAQPTPKPVRVEEINHFHFAD